MDPTQWAAPFPLVVAALFCIVLLRSNGTYWLGRAAAHTARRTRASRWLDSAGYRRAVDRINRWGAPAVSLSFLTVGVQTVINLAAGATRMPLIRYIPATVIGSIAWAFLYGTVGFAGFEALAVLWEHSPRRRSVPVSRPWPRWSGSWCGRPGATRSKPRMVTSRPPSPTGRTSPTGPESRFEPGHRGRCAGREALHPARTIQIGHL